MSRNYLLNFVQQPTQIDLDSRTRFSVIPPRAPLNDFSKLTHFSNRRIKNIEAAIAAIVKLCQERGGWLPFRMSFLIGSIRSNFNWRHFERDDGRLFIMLTLTQCLDDLVSLGFLELDEEEYYQICDDFVELVANHQLVA